MDRKKYLGGADAPVILGLSQYKSPYQLYCEKKNGDIIEPNIKMRLGLYLEEFIRIETENATGHIIIPNKVTVQSKGHSFLAGTPDGFIVDENLTHTHLVEFKTSFNRHIDINEIDPTHKVQVQYYMWLTGLSKCILAYLFNGELKIHEIDADPSSQAYIVKSMIDFWERLQNDNPPPVRGVIDCNIKYFDAGTEIIADDLIFEKFCNYKDLINQKKNIESIIEDQKTEIIDYMGNNSVLTFENRTIATYKANKNNIRIFKTYGND